MCFNYDWLLMDNRTFFFLPIVQVIISIILYLVFEYFSACNTTIFTCYL